MTENLIHRARQLLIFLDERATIEKLSEDVGEMLAYLATKAALLLPN